MESLKKRKNNMYYLCKRNDYGDNNIVSKLDNYLDVINSAIKNVTKDNMENALSMDEKLKDFKSVFPLAYNESGERIDNIIYAGLGNLGKHMFIYVDPETGTEEKVESNSLTDVNIKFFLGTDNSKEYYLKNYISKSKNKEQVETSDFKNNSLERKTFYYIKKV
jgi:hypothetical protein